MTSLLVLYNLICSRVLEGWEGVECKGCVWVVPSLKMAGCSAFHTPPRLSVYCKCCAAVSNPASQGSILLQSVCYCPSIHFSPNRAIIGVEEIATLSGPVHSQ